jgi:hypothetical protein
MCTACETSSSLGERQIVVTKFACPPLAKTLPANEPIPETDVLVFKEARTFIVTEYAVWARDLFDERVAIRQSCLKLEEKTND